MPRFRDSAHGRCDSPVPGLPLCMPVNLLERPAEDSASAMGLPEASRPEHPTAPDSLLLRGAILESAHAAHDAPVERSWRLAGKVPLVRQSRDAQRCIQLLMNS